MSRNREFVQAVYDSRIELRVLASGWHNRRGGQGHGGAAKTNAFQAWCETIAFILCGYEHGFWVHRHRSSPAKGLGWMKSRR